jgi:hypothetical protein
VSQHAAPWECFIRRRHVARRPQLIEQCGCFPDVVEFLTDEELRIVFEQFSARTMIENRRLIPASAPPIPPITPAPAIFRRR